MKSELGMKIMSPFSASMTVALIPILTTRPSWLRTLILLQNFIFTLAQLNLWLSILFSPLHPPFQSRRSGKGCLRGKRGVSGGGWGVFNAEMWKIVKKKHTCVAQRGTEVL